MTTPPYRLLIWALRRSASSNLTQRLVELAGQPRVEHEPFGKPHLHANVVRHWRSSGDRSALLAGVGKVCDAWPMLKHCPETVPDEVSLALLDEACQRGYRHLFLYRRNPADRLLSLRFAQLTGVWGKKNASKSKIDTERLFAEPLPVEAMVAHEARCNLLLQRLWDRLIQRGVQPTAQAFEDIFQIDDSELAASRLKALVAALGVDASPQALDNFVAETLKRGDQGTRAAYQNFRGLSDLHDALASVTSFRPTDR
jgi:hypothetical protein